MRKGCSHNSAYAFSDEATYIRSLLLEISTSNKCHANTPISLIIYCFFMIQVSATTKGGAIQGAWSPSATIRTKEDC